MPWLAAAAVAAPIVGGLVGNVMSQGDRNKARQSMKQALEELKAAGMPPDMSKEIIYKQFEAAGILTPEMEEDIQLADTEFRSIQEDPQLREMQLEALNKFKQQSETGLGAEERAAFNQMQQAIRQDQRGQQQQILADAQRRGQGGGGAALIAQLQASQSGADQAASQGNELAALIAQRVRQGAQDMSGAAQGLRSQDYQVASDRAQAIDERNRMLNANSISRQQRNVASRNDAQRYNLENAQNISNMNTEQANAEKLRQTNAERQYYQDKMDRAKAIANAYTGQQQYYQDQAAQTAQQFAGAGQGVGQAASAFAKKK